MSDSFYPLRHESVNPALIANVTKAVAALFPIRTEDGKTEITASNVWIDTGKFDPHALNAHQDARQTGKTLQAPIYADLTLNHDSKRVQNSIRYNLGSLPLMNDLGTFMVNGNDYYTPMAQLRLKPGAYTREKTNGEYETFIPMKGAQISVWMDPARGVLKLGFYSANVSWYAIVRALGATDDQIVGVLGGDKRARELLEENRLKNPEADVKKLFLAIFERNVNRDLVRAGIQKRDQVLFDTDYAGQVAAIRTWFDGQELDPYVTNKTLGKPISKAGVELLLQSARRILSVSRHESEPDDRDALEFKSAVGVEEMLPERISKQGRFLQRKALQRLRGGDVSLARALGKDFLSSVTTSYFGGTQDIDGGLANTAEAANPLAILSEQNKLTLTGEGGIQSSHAITIDARLFRPSATNFIDPVRTPEGSQIGITTHAAVNVIKEGTHLKAPFFKVFNGRVDRSKNVFLTTEEAADAVVSYPEFFDKDGKAIDDEIRANIKGEIQSVPANTIEYVIPSGASAFDHTSNAALLLAHTHPTRGMMAGKHLTQALPLVHRELPLFGLKDFMGRDVLEGLARTFTIRARVDGKVEKVEPGRIVIAGKEHQIYDQYGMQAKIALHHNPTVKVGDIVHKGDLIADSNYSRDGKLALGTNLKSGYLPWKNASTFEDAIVVSRSGAKKLTSEHLHRLSLELQPDITIDRDLAFAQFPTRFTKDSYAKLEKNGVIKEGLKIVPGDPLIAAVRKTNIDAMDRRSENLSNIHRALMRPYRDAGVYWDEIFPGTVYRVIRTREKIEIHVKTEEVLVSGDKLSMSSAAKGTIAAIIDDDKMPRDEKGNPLEIIFNPHGVAGRINPSQVIESGIGKLVREGGTPYNVTNFDGVHHAREVEKLLKDKGLTHEETLYDPESGKHLEKKVAVGFNYVLKLDHPVRKKFSARGTNSYTMDEVPTTGKGAGAAAYDQLTTYALLGHNAHAILGESVGIRGTKNEDFWRAYQAGEQPPPPKVPFAFNKLEAYLNAAGVDTNTRGTNMSFSPMTDARVLEKSHGEITNATLLKTRSGKDKSLAEETGGLFDPKITGGIFGEHAAHIELSEKIPHPLFEKITRDITGLKTADYYGLLAQTRHYDPKTKKFSEEKTENTTTGAKAFEHLLDFDPDDKLKEIKAKLKTAVGSDQNKLNRAAKYMNGLKTTGLKATDAYLMGVVPVIAPTYRGITELSDGSLRVADSNLLYRDVILANDQVRKAKDARMPDDHVADARTTLYKSIGALIGVNNPLTHREDREDAKGFIDTLKGRSNKEGFFQRIVARRRNDFTGRSTIEPDSNFGADEIGIPEEMSWTIYRPTIIRRLSLLGYDPAEASKAVEEHKPEARAALEEEMKTRPVLYNRSPSLHRWSVAAAMPRITTGKEIRISPIVLGPLGGDADGDTVSITVPITEEARKESYNLLASKNLVYERNLSLAYGLDKDIITGIFALTKPGAPTGLTFGSEAEAIDVYKNNKNSSLKMGSLVTIKGQGQQAIGWMMLKAILPPKFMLGLSAPVDGKKLKTLLERIAKESPGDYNVLSKRLMQAGFLASSMAGGITSTVGELNIDRTKIDRLLNQMDKDISKGKTYADKQRLTLEANEKYEPLIHAELQRHFDAQDIGFKTLLEAKSSGKFNMTTMNQMFGSPMVVSDTRDQVVPSVIKSAYGSGMKLSDYILTTPGARKGMVAKSLATALPGFLAKEIAGNMGSVRIEIKDCGTETGIDIELDPEDKIKGHDLDILDRHLLHDIPVINVKRNDVVTPGMLSKLRDKHVKAIWVRSPMTCKAPSPPCQYCAGASPDGKLYPIGANIGLNFGTGISERSTQLTLRVFHSGGTLGSGDSLMAGFQRFRELLSAPETIRDQGVLADKAGRVDEIRLAPQGGWTVKVNGHEQHILQGRNVKVHVGDHVEIGDPLSDGNYLPGEIAEKKGLLAAQKYVTLEGRKSFLDSGEIIRKPVLEVLVAGLMRYMTIDDDGGEPDLVVGNVIHENEFDLRKKNNPKIQGHPSGLGISSKPLLSNDLLERMNFQRIESAISEVPASGGHSDLTGSKSPIPGIAFGSKFRMAPVFVHEE